MKKDFACPSCHQQLILDSSKQVYLCEQESLSFPIKDGIPVFIINEAQKQEG